MAKKPFDPTTHLLPAKDAMTWEERQQILDQLIRALAVEAARADHREAHKQAQKKKGGRPRKKRLKI